METTKEKKILVCTFKTLRGVEVVNELKLSEAHLIAKMAQEHGTITVKLRTITINQYKSIFGS